MERLAEALTERAAGAYLIGRDVPGSTLRVIPDPPGLEGPLAGMVAAFRLFPASAWIFAACDLPGLRPEAARWLAAQRGPGRWAVVPSVSGCPQPLLALYEPAAAPLLEGLVDRGVRGPRHLVGHPRVFMPEPPTELASCWQDVDTPEELGRWSGLG